VAIDPTWMDLISGIVGAVLGWFARHFTNPK
jgi:F0F1-type ATP synthase assembly protein I